MDKILVALLLVVISLVSFVAFSDWHNQTQIDLEQTTETRITNVLNE